MSTVGFHHLFANEIELFLNNVKVSKKVVVNPDKTGDYSTISDAVLAAPNNALVGDGYFVIHIVAGVYHEYISIPTHKKYLMMIGDGIGKTIITGNRSSSDGWGSSGSATFGVAGDGFVAIQITFQNTAGPIKNQSVALRNEADMSAFYRCNFEGYQDTLLTDGNRQFYRECDIYGTIDFIWGDATVVLQNCNIYFRLPLEGQFNVITAQGKTASSSHTGISIQNCTILAADDLARSSRTVKSYFGRPWREYATTVVMQSLISSVIDPAGWAPWSNDFALSTLYYAEYDNRGPGSNTNNRVTWLGYHIISAKEAVNFTVKHFIEGDFWLSRTGVPYYGGLM
ncbi:hypothetical protein JCGZ_23286 [Jatropha curcas]|uniref:Pectinesterase catalytic domain-containing protein n=1 Tax=Jatropha curcas TaxID=180498 RepID=A0A067JKV3_JATCU|nr:hypothetical protein JCGZ_23286 [Jatropha curcas]